MVKSLSDTQNRRRQGKVRWFNEGKGFGFIESDGEYFVVYQDALTNVDLTAFLKGAPVTFEVKQGKKGPQAEAVQMV